MVIVTVLKTHASAMPTEELTAGRRGLEAQFHFSIQWDGLGKTAVWEAGGVTKDAILSEDCCEVPHECMIEDEDLRVGVFGMNADGDTVIPTVYALVGHIQRGADPSGDESYPPTPSVGEQAIALTEQAREAAKAAKAEAEAAEEAAVQSQEAAQGANQSAAQARADAESAAIDARAAKLLVQTATDASTKAKESAQAAAAAAVLAQDAAHLAAADAEDAVEAANDVKSRADSGEFDGGYYAPRLEQEDGEAFAIGFTPSKEGMPPVESQPVQLPKVIMLEKGETVPDNLPPGQLIYIPDEEGTTPEEAVVLEVLTALGLAPVVPGDDGTLVTADDGTVLLNL